MALTLVVTVKLVTIQVTQVLDQKLLLGVGELSDLQTTMDTNTVDCICMHY